MSKTKLYWEKEKKREREGKKREKEKRKKEEKKEKREEKEKEKERKVNKKKGGGSNQKSKRKKNTGEYLLILYTLSLLTSPGTCPSSWSSGGGACCADFQVLALEGAALPPTWCRAQWGLFTR